MPVEQALATFKDRHTLVYERTYPHAIDLVFEAVSTGEHLNEWMLPGSRVERRKGGACAFGWGSPADDPAATRGTVTVFDPPSAIEYSFEGATDVKDDGSFMRFDLVAEGPESTQLFFTLHFLPAPDEQPQDYSGDDLPVPGTAWRPGFVAGYHDFLDDLRTWLRGELDLEAKIAEIEARGGSEQELMQAYREHIRDNCPSD